MTNPLVKTLDGELQGIEADGTISWRGIPYSQAPTGPRRWMEPQPPSPWAGVLKAHQFPTRAPQILTPGLVPPGGATPSDDGTPMGEDCLFLNITAPSTHVEGPLPVLVWFHGGGYAWGSGANFIGDGTGLAREGIIVVTVNYRLGALGFLKLDHLLGPQYSMSANAGLLDQIAALRWVKQNIAAFGGDTSRVTVAGVSAGAKSVANLMASPLAAGLFHRGIMQSGGEHLNSPESAMAITSGLLNILELPTNKAELLVTLPTDTLLQAQQEMAAGVRQTWVWRPTIDGLVLHETPTQAFATGKAKGISLLAGITANEAGSYDLTDPTAADQVPRVLQEIFGSRAEEILNTYRTALPLAEPRALHRSVLADERYGIPTIRLLDAQSSHSTCWRYRFDAPTPGAPQEKWGFHGADVPFIWNIGMETSEPSIQALATGMRQAWTTFISEGKPEATDLPFWPEYDSGERRTMLLDTPARVVSDPGKDQRASWSCIQWQPDTWWQLPALFSPSTPSERASS